MHQGPKTGYDNIMFLFCAQQAAFSSVGLTKLDTSFEQEPIYERQ